MEEIKKSPAFVGGGSISMDAAEKRVSRPLSVAAVGDDERMAGRRARGLCDGASARGLLRRMLLDQTSYEINRLAA